MIKVKNLALALMALVLAACSNDQIDDNVNALDSRQVIALKVSDISSRAGRPLTSTQAGQSIENVKIILTDQTNTVVWTKLLSAWNSADASVMQSVPTQGGREAEIEIPKDEYRLLSGETYHVYAYGYSNASDYDLTPITALKSGDKLSSDLSIRIKDGVPGEETFAGYCSVTGNMGGVRAELVLSRQVAGTFAYLTKIPYVSDASGKIGKYLILTSANPHNELALGQLDNSAYVVNGKGQATESVIFTIDLTDWFSVIMQSTDENGHPTGLIKAGDNWIGDTKRYKRGSVFAGNFVIPTSKVDAPTLQLKLCWANDPATALRTWNVLLPTDAKQLNEYSVIQYVDGAWSNVTVTDNDVVYNLLRNHLYAVGTRLSDRLPSTDPNNPDKPGDADDPDTDEDTPEPINNKQELTVIVSHAWDAIYNMGVE